MRNCQGGPQKVARNSIEQSFNKVRKRCNSNDLNSMFEIVAGELRAKLGAVSAMPQVRSGHDTCAAARPGRASRRRAQPPISHHAPLLWRVPEGPEGTGGLRDRHFRAAGSRVAISRAAGPGGTRHSGTTPQPRAAANKRSAAGRKHHGQPAWRAAGPEGTQHSGTTPNNNIKLRPASSGRRAQHHEQPAWRAAGPEGTRHSGSTHRHVHVP